MGEEKVVLTPTELDEFLEKHGLYVVDGTGLVARKNDTIIKKAKITSKMYEFIKKFIVKSAFWETVSSNYNNYAENKAENKIEKMEEEVIEKEKDLKADSDNFLKSNNIVSASIKNIGLVSEKMNVEQAKEKLEAKKTRFQEKFYGVKAVKIEEKATKKNNVLIGGIAKLTENAYNNLKVFSKMYMENINDFVLNKQFDKITSLEEKKEKLETSVANSSNPISAFFDSVRIARTEDKIDNLETKVNDKLYPKEEEPKEKEPVIKPNKFNAKDFMEKLKKNGVIVSEDESVSDVDKMVDLSLKTKEQVMKLSEENKNLKDERDLYKEKADEQEKINKSNAENIKLMANSIAELTNTLKNYISNTNVKADSNAVNSELEVENQKSL